MFIHIGEKNVVSDRSIVGIFNADTLRISNTNAYYINQLDLKDKTVVVDIKNTVRKSIVSPFTVIKRSSVEDGVVWRKQNVK